MQPKDLLFRLSEILRAHKTRPQDDKTEVRSFRMEWSDRPVRLWSLHPKYLDAKGLAAVWREGLLAQKVLAGRTRGYRNHPQLSRFRESGRPLSAIGAYLRAVRAEAARRGYSFDGRKIRSGRSSVRLAVKRGQLMFEWNYLLAKLERRDGGKFLAVQKVKRPLPHPLFRVTAGGIEDWERRGT